MTDAVQIFLPAATVARLESLIAQQQTINAVIEATVATARETLEVPQDWTLRNVHEGFIPPTPQPVQES